MGEQVTFSLPAHALHGINATRKCVQDLPSCGGSPHAPACTSGKLGTRPLKCQACFSQRIRRRGRAFPCGGRPPGRHRSNTMDATRQEPAASEGSCFKPLTASRSLLAKSPSANKEHYDGKCLLQLHDVFMPHNTEDLHLQTAKLLAGFSQNLAKSQIPRHSRSGK